MEGRQGKNGTADDETGLAVEETAVRDDVRQGARRAGNSSRRYSVEEKVALLEEFERGDETLTMFCARKHVSTATMCAWRKARRSRGEAGLVAHEPRRNASGKTGRPRTGDERRQAVEAFTRSGMTRRDFSRAWGLSQWTLADWLERYRDEGPKGLETRLRGRKPGEPAPFARTVPDGVRAEIARTKLRFPTLGLRGIRDFVKRFQGIFVSHGTVARVLDEQKIERAAPQTKAKRRRALPRRFERAVANDLWQTDITSFVIGRARLRVYLIVFLDDFSRFVVSHGLYVYQRGEIAKETLLVGIGRYGKPNEVLSDQGRQYFAWRGKAEFQKLLAKHGIHHAVARAHHPETVGKCERLWKTVKEEFVERVELEDLSDARERLGHWIAHYNFFRPHQGIDGLVPADRFFGAQEALRATHEARLGSDELGLALHSSPRTSAYLFGQIGDEQVSVHGERGRLVVQTNFGLRKEIGLDELGAPSEAQKETSDGHGSGGNGGTERVGAQAATADRQEATALRGAREAAAWSEGALESSAARGAAASTPDVRADLGDVAGEEGSRSGGERTRDPAAAGVAAQSTGAVGDAGGLAEAAASATWSPGGRPDRERGRSAAVEEEDRDAGTRGARSGRIAAASFAVTPPDEWAAGIDCCGEEP